LGWVLNCRGIICRTVFGIPDEKSIKNKFIYANELLDSIKKVANTYIPSTGELKGIINFENYFTNTFNNIEDGMSDRFFYMLPNGTKGIFRYDFIDKNKIIMLPYQPLKIENIINGTYPFERKINSIKITDEDGTIYIFQPFVEYNNEIYTEYYLKKIISADSTETIEFFYKSQTNKIEIYDEKYIFLGKPIFSIAPTCNSSESPFSQVYKNTSQPYYFKQPVIDSIVSTNVNITFSYYKRLDFLLYRLREIIVKTREKPERIIYRIQFNHKYFGTSNIDYRLCLDNIIFNSFDNNNPQKFEFTYENLNLPPYPSKMSNPIYSEDYWGYYNGKNSSNLIPYDFIPDEEKIYREKSQYSDREPDTNYSKACMLKQIKYPTGGKTVFQFERNFARGVYLYKNYQNQDGFYGGYRIKKIINYNEDNEIINTKTYEYLEEEARPIEKNLFTYKENYIKRENDCWVNFSRDLVFSDPIFPLEISPGLPIMYKTVIEYNGSKENNSGKTIYRYDTPYSPAPIYLDYHPEHPIEYEELRFYHPYHYDHGNYQPELCSKTEYSFDGKNYRTVSTYDYNYSILNNKEFQTGINLIKTTQYESYTYFIVFCLNTFLCNFSEIVQNYINSIIAIDTKAFQQAKVISSIDNYIYDEFDLNKYVLNKTNFHYDENFLQLKKKIIYTGKNEKNKIIDYNYPFDFSLNEPYKTMVQRNIISPIIEQIEKIDNTYIKSHKINYFKWSNNIIEPLTIETKNSINNNYETRIRYHKYDKYGNVLSLSKENDLKISYYWSYNNTYPIVEAKNTDYSTIEQKVNQAKQQAGIKDFNAITEPSKNTNQLNQWKAFNNYLRNSLPNAMIKTYTYLPLIGMTSETDENCKTTYYEYDNFGRLKYIKDQDLNITQEYNYNYSTQPYLKVSTTNINFTSSGGSQNLTVTSKCGYTATVTTGNSWISTNISGNILLVNVKVNNSTTTRTGTILIESDGLNKTITITQNGAPPYLNVTLNGNEIEELIFDNNYRSEILNLKATVSWSVTIKYYNISNWIYVNPSSGTGDNNNIRIGVYENYLPPQGSYYYAEVIFSGEGVNKTFWVIWTNY